MNENIKSRNFLIGNRKGGMGKSFTTIMLATALSQDYKKKVLVIECDSQKSITKIRGKERAVSPEEPVPYDVIFTPVKRLKETVVANVKKFEIIFIDMPRITDEDDDTEKEQEEVLSLLLLAECVLVPVSAHELDMDGSDDFVELINELKEYRTGLKLPFSVFAFHNRSRGIAEDKMIPLWAEANEIELFETTVKESVHLERNLSTYVSIQSVTDLSAKLAVNNYKSLIKEFVTKFNIS